MICCNRSVKFGYLVGLDHVLRATGGPVH